MDEGQWHEKFVDALTAQIARGVSLEYAVLNLECHDWIQSVAPYDLVIWQPKYMGPRSAGYFKEKVYFLERILGKLVVPGFSSIWHFESKAAQSYLFETFGVPTPRTIVTFDYDDARACLAASEMPMVFKKSHGASSKNVRLLNHRAEAIRTITNAFSQQAWNEVKWRHESMLQRLQASIFTPWFWVKVVQKITGDERVGLAYWQEYVGGNEADLRITVIGDRFAYGFWRMNRANDFRASGSGRPDYQRPIPKEVLHYCLELNRKFGFDSMAYDILFGPGGFVLTEMSYAYLDSFLYNSSGHYELTDAADLEFREGHVWPQDLWTEWALIRARRELDK